MIRAVIVRTIRNHKRQSVSVSIRTNKVITCCFAGRIRRFRVVRSFFGKESCFAKSAINFICRNVVEEVFSFSFWEIPIEFITDAPLENLTDLVKQERKRLAEICYSPGDDALEYILAEEYRAATVNLSYVENL